MRRCLPSEVRRHHSCSRRQSPATSHASVTTFWKHSTDISFSPAATSCNGGPCVPSCLAVQTGLPPAPLHPPSTISSWTRTKLVANWEGAPVINTDNCHCKLTFSHSAEPTDSVAIWSPMSPLAHKSTAQNTHAQHIIPNTQTQCFCSADVFSMFLFSDKSYVPYYNPPYTIETF